VPDGTTWINLDNGSLAPTLAAVAALDRVEVLISGRHHWTKGHYSRGRGAFKSYCLLEALRVATHNATGLGYEPALRALRQAVPWRGFGLFKSVVWFNDDKTTTHADVLAVVRRARLSLVEADLAVTPKVAASRWSWRGQAASPSPF
jgi:hypothetical protein